MRKLPAQRNFLIAAGLEQALGFLENARFTPEDLEWVSRQSAFRREFVEHLAKWRFSGDVHAMPEGTIFFPNEPILRVTAPLPQAQLVESRLINLIQFQTLIASKAARSVCLRTRSCWSTSACAALMARRRAYWPRGPATWRVLPAAQRCWLRRCTVCPSMVRWPTRLSRRTRMRRQPSIISLTRCREM